MDKKEFRQIIMDSRITELCFWHSMYPISPSSLKLISVDFETVLPSGAPLCHESEFYAVSLEIKYELFILKVQKHHSERNIICPRLLRSHLWSYIDISRIRHWLDLMFNTLKALAHRNDSLSNSFWEGARESSPHFIKVMSFEF